MNINHLAPGSDILVSIWLDKMPVGSTVSLSSNESGAFVEMYDRFADNLFHPLSGGIDAESFYPRGVDDIEHGRGLESWELVAGMVNADLTATRIW